MTNVKPLALPANATISSALAQGLISQNTQVSTVNGVAVAKGSTVAALISVGILNPSFPASTLGVSGQFGGD